MLRSTGTRLTAYVDDHLVGSGKIAQAAIVGQGGGVWATSSGLQVCIGGLPSSYLCSRIPMV